jgi:outer membrane lipoprotein
MRQRQLTFKSGRAGMKRTKQLLYPLVVLFMAGLSGCTYYVASAYVREARNSPSYEMIAKNPDTYKGAVVVWGGEILETVNNKNSSELVIVQMPLDIAKMPEHLKLSMGRFIAKSKAFLDPAVYKKGRKIVVAGEVAGSRTLPVGNTRYTYPVLDIKQLHVFHKKYYYYSPMYYYGWDNGFGGPYWPYDSWDDFGEEDD